MSCFRLLGIVALLLCFSATRSTAQYVPPDTERSLHLPNAHENQAEQDAELQHRMAEARQKQRFQDMKRDSQKILELATELKQYVDKSGENMLSVEVVRKAEELEKLAHQVKNNMRGE